MIKRHMAIQRHFTMGATPSGWASTVGVVFWGEYGMQYGMTCFQRTHLLVDVPDPGGISWSG